MVTLKQDEAEWEPKRWLEPPGIPRPVTAWSTKDSRWLHPQVCPLGLIVRLDSKMARYLKAWKPELFEAILF